MSNSLTELSRVLNFTFGSKFRSSSWRRQEKGFRLPRAFVMTDEKRLPDPITILDRLSPDIAIIFRHYNHDHRRILAHKLVDHAHRRGVQVLIAGDFRLAQIARADGVHIPSYMLGTQRIQRTIHARPNWLFTAAVHNAKELYYATKLDIHAALASPVYKTTTRIQRNSLGPIGLLRLTHSTKIPIFALGGLTRFSIPTLKNTGVAGFAGIGEFLKFV